MLIFRNYKVFWTFYFKTVIDRYFEYWYGRWISLVRYDFT